MLLRLISIKDLRLRIKSINIKKINYSIFFIIKNMIKLMYNYNGIGISSNQINYFKKIIIIDVNLNKTKPIIMINPKIVYNNYYFTLGNEGCLSIKNFNNSIIRSDKIFVKFYNIYYKKKIKIFHGLQSRCIQHEIDHLNGKLIVDYNKKNIFYKCTKNIY